MLYITLTVIDFCIDNIK